MIDWIANLADWQLLALTPPGWGMTLLVGFVGTLQIAIGGYLLGLILGIGGATGKLYGGPVTKDLLEVYTLMVRAVPPLILILLLFYAGAGALNRLLAVVGLGSVNISGLAAGIFVIGVVQGAYQTEVLRGAFKAVPFGQIEAARAFGMNGWQVLRRITLPAMLPHAIPGLANLWLICTKDTVLLAVVGFTELVLATRQAAGTTKAYMLFFLAAGAVYLALTLVSNIAIAYIEKRARKGMPAPL
jgi:polar amino acid transport system permease protein